LILNTGNPTNQNKENRSTTEETNSVFNNDYPKAESDNDSLRSLSDQAAKFSPAGAGDNEVKKHKK